MNVRLTKNHDGQDMKTPNRGASSSEALRRKRAEDLKLGQKSSLNTARHEVSLYEEQRTRRQLTPGVDMSAVAGLRSTPQEA